MKKIEKIFTEYNMTEPRFWQLVAQANWPDEDYNTAKLRYLQTVKRKEGHEFTHLVVEMYCLLDNFIGVRVHNLAVGDDSYSDLLHHIIGLGQEQFMAHLKSYAKIKARAKAPYDSAKGYKESYQYAVPTHDEWGNIKTSIKELKSEIEAKKNPPEGKTKVILTIKAKKNPPEEKTKVILTDEQRIAHVLGLGLKCPVCHDGDIEGSMFQADSGNVWQNMSCNECNIEWQDVYSLTDVLGR